MNNVFAKFKEEEILKSYNFFKKEFKNSVFLNKLKIRELAIQLAYDESILTSSNFFLEFGVYKAESINFFSKFLKKKRIYGFDTFYGLTENWNGYVFKKGHFSTGGKLPAVKKNVTLIKGDVRDTLVPFLKKYKPKIKFIHLDVDTYQSSKFILQKTKPFLAKNAYILFDEYYNIAGWRHSEYKAFNEVFKRKDYDYISFAIDTSQVLVRIK